MFGPPGDVDNECNARLYICDDFGDNTSTMRCQLKPGHDGPHVENFQRDEGVQQVSVTWTVDERKPCDHGCGAWADHPGIGSGCSKYAERHEFETCQLCWPQFDPFLCPVCGVKAFSVAHYNWTANEVCKGDGKPTLKSERAT